LFHMQRLRGPYTDVVADHQCSQLRAVHQHHLEPMTVRELVRRAGEVGCGHKYSFACFRRTQASAESPDFRLTHRYVQFVSLGLQINSVETQGVLIDYPVDAPIPALADRPSCLLSRASVA